MPTGVVTCPNCGAEEEMEIPKKKCIPSYECNNCEKTITAKNECCVFCEYGDKDCPIAQESC